MKVLASKKAMPKIGKAVDDRLNILLDEIMLSTTWSRPSILLALHKSKNHQEQTIFTMERRLAELSIEVVHITPGKDQLDILNIIRQKLTPNRNVFFVRGLGHQDEIYNGLNLHREMIVENQIKLIFWLTNEECISLSHKAPDFWAFRHRVVEFPSRRNSSRHLLPSGVLLWHEQYRFEGFETVRQKIVSQENAVKNLPDQAEATTNHVMATGNLAYLYWLTGDNHKAEDLIRRELEKIRPFQLDELKSSLLNGQSISCYDRGSYEEALVLIEEALAHRPEDGILWANHGIICRAAGQSARSLASIKKAIKNNSNISEFWGSIGYVYISMGKFDNALSSFEKALSINPESIQFMLALAVCFSQLGYFDRFDKIMESISASTQGENSYLRVCYDYLKGSRLTALNQLQEMTKSEKISRSLLQRDPSLHFILGIDALLTIH